MDATDYHSPSLINRGTKNEYFGKKAEAINTASESWEIEEELRSARNYSSSKRLLINPIK